MEELKTGVLVQFLKDMDVDGKNKQERKPVMLQIRSIIPVLKENGLFPNQGFFLKVSDLSHALYVLLPQEKDDMVLGNRLHIGQFIVVDTLEAAYPVPMLKGIKPIPGRHPCYGNPKDILPIQNLEKFLGVPNLDDYNDDSAAKFNDRPRSVSASKATSVSNSTGRCSLNSITEEGVDAIRIRSNERAHSSSRRSIVRPPFEEKKYPQYLDGKQKRNGVRSTVALIPRRSSDVPSYDKISHKTRTIQIDRDCDLDSMMTSSSSLSALKRRSWGGKEAAMPSESPNPELVAKPSVNAPSFCPSPTHGSSKYESSDETASTTKSAKTSIDASSDDENSETKRIVAASSTTRSSSASRRSNGITSRKLNGDPANGKKISSSTTDKHLTEIEISWDLLPPDLVKYGQDVLRERDAALQTAIEALQEACAAERLLKCLRIYSELDPTKANDQHHSIDKFFSLQGELSQTSQIMQSLTCARPPKAPNNNSNASHSIKQSVKLAIDRKKNAASWIKSALAMDLNRPVPDLFSPESSTSTKRSTKAGGHSPNHKPKPALISSNSKSNDDNAQPKYKRGRSLPVSTELAESLGNECTSWFMRNVEDYLDWISSRQQSDNQVGEMMYRIKRVNDWLDFRGKQDPNMEDNEFEACRRVRDKIYGILLKHVERTAINSVPEC